MAGNLYDKIKEYCINQLVDAINGTGLYKAKAENDDKTAVKDILNNKGIQDIQKYAKDFVEALVVPDTYSNPNDIFRRLLISGQNRNMMPNVINFMGREEIFKQILGTEEQFNYKKVLNTYKAAEELLNEFKKNFNIKKSKRDDDISENTNEAKPDRSLWAQYAKFIVGAALLIENVSKTKAYNKYSTILEKFKNGLDELAKDYSGEYKCQEYLANEITGMGFALACDFLKEISGDMAKPDTHIMDYLEKYHFKALNEKEKTLEDYKENKNIKKREVAAVKVMDDIAKENKCDIYALDKLIWLCCSGNYYKKGNFDGIVVEPKSLKDLFLDKI